MDQIDERIIARLLDDGRASFRRVGDAVGLSAPAVKRRVDRLVADGVIERFTVAVAPERLGWTAEAFIELFCEARTPPRTIRAAMAPHPEVVGAYTITGDADALVHVRVRDTADLEQVLERMRGEPFVTQTRSVVVLSRLLRR